MDQQLDHGGSRSSTTIDDDLENASKFGEPAIKVEAEIVDPFLVQFDEGEAANPFNWSRLKRWYLTLASGLLVLNATFASSAPSGIVPQLMEEFHLGETVGILTISLFVAGYCVGPLLWGPLSEQYGRRPIFVWPFLAYTGFQVGSALSKNTASVLIFRFLGGFFAAAPLTNSGALISDVWDAETRGKALAIFTVAPFSGPALGPTVAGFLAVAGVSWRWVFWILTIFAGLCWLLIFFTIPETYRPVLLVAKAKRLRKETGDERYYAPLERVKRTAVQSLEHTLARPFKMLFTEPMLIAMTAYMSFVYGCLYLLFEAYPVVYTEGHGFNLGISGLMFLSVPIGGCTAVTLYVLIFAPRYRRKALELAPAPVPPEFRLEMSLIAAPLYAISFFWFAWTSDPSISYWAPLMSGVLMGFSISWLFLPLFTYIIDAYIMAAASALASNTVVRSLAGAGFPLFAGEMYKALGPQWASSLLGFVAVAMMPIPFVLMKYGPYLRKKSKYAPT
ncbi:hypothetical protein PC9H_003493 [Pleurotus ostreatus]|uniref:Major facilitator superfamily (MFS) profile domain-containing protein n=1 Tax=Pleurotus ostreatus TaxID=5322 RepID=A0A8H6ZYG2_PLEOS|nr:uncharacterized protein PC9H_003493 [Pleurotus ostreatus]KAF7436660.1 hypothetical protein PC9H_003493 [Pleurotus ostreatus]